MTDKNKNLLKEITKRLVHSYHPQRVILFGSYAYGEPTDDSDFDILIIIEESALPQYKRSRLGYSQLHDIDVPVELIVMTREEIARSENVVTSIAYKALKDGIVLYG